MTNQHTIVIGGGPGGAATAIYLARFFHEVTLIDAGEAVPGRTGMASHLENFLGNDEATSGANFLKRINKQLDKFKVKRVSDTVTSVHTNQDGFVIEALSATSYKAKYVVVAVGVGDNMPQIDGLDPYYDNAIFHCLTCDWYWNKDRKAAVIANDDMGLKSALMIATLHHPPKLSVVPSEHNPRFSPELLDRAQALGISVATSPLTKLHGNGKHFDYLILEDGTQVETEIMFTKLGHVHFDDFLGKGGLKPDRDEDGFLVVDFRTFETSVENLFAVGPCNTGPDQAIIAGGQGALAALEIHHRILAEVMK